LTAAALVGLVGGLAHFLGVVLGGVLDHVGVFFEALFLCTSPAASILSARASAVFSAGDLPQAPRVRRAALAAATVRMRIIRSAPSKVGSDRGTLKAAFGSLALPMSGLRRNYWVCKHQS
jgi:hypothetical protein